MRCTNPVPAPGPASPEAATMKAATEYAVLTGGAGTAITALLHTEPVRTALA